MRWVSASSADGCQNIPPPYWTEGPAQRQRFFFPERVGHLLHGCRLTGRYRRDILTGQTNGAEILGWA